MAVAQADQSVSNMERIIEKAKDNLELQSVKVLKLSGSLYVEVSPVPASVEELKESIAEATGIPSQLQQLVHFDGTLLESIEALDPEMMQVTMMVDETPLSTWQVDGNTCKEMLWGECGVVKATALRTDYVNVLTQVPVMTGRHYFQFVMHCIGDEQWCGVTNVQETAGSRFSGRSLKAWTYYCGRMGSSSGNLRDGTGALHVLGKAQTGFKKVRPKGDVIGMAIDVDMGRLAFDLNGDLQGAVGIPRSHPMWLLTHLDRTGDHVELLKVPLEDAPQATIRALDDPLPEA